MVEVNTGIMRKAVALGAMVVLSGALLSSVSSVSARNLEDYSQGLPKPSKEQVRLTPQSMQNGSTDESVLVPALNGIVVVTKPDDVRLSGVSASGVVIEDDVIPASVQAAAAGYIGKPVSLANLDRMTRDMVLAFRSAGMPVVNVVVPPQDITAGSVQVIAVVGRMGKLTITGQAKDLNYYSEGFELEEGEVVSEAKVLDQLRWKSRRAHRNVTAIYAPGSGFSETDITFDVDEQKPWSVFSGVDNTGNSTVGDYRIFAGAVIGDLWGLDHEMSYQFTTSEEGPKHLGAHVVSYTLPVPFASRTDLNLLGSYVSSEGKGSITKQTGESYQLSANFLSQLPRTMGISLDARYGYEFKSSNNDLEFGGLTASSTRTEISQFYAQILGQKNWAWGLSNFNAGLWVSPGKMTSKNFDSAFRQARAGTSASYAILRAGLEQSINLPKDIILTVDAETQWASERLLASEMMYLGGMRTIRGFTENVAKGDNGAMARIELNSPGFQLLGRASDIKDQIRAFAFFDVGTVSNNGTLVAGDVDTMLAGAGLGLKYQIANHLDAQLGYGWKVLDDDNVEKDDGALHFRMVVRY
ncbi:MAG: hypothetical protein N4A65_11845 [Cohaesibacter sp.]|jgi:hemolysin activation/secretion protein|nr:hypothetical protein [Cohaesibacter sp.]